ncbi:hypothetical protein N0V93_008514 [Gnomoniopsis smithogilvyi]|uniref:FAD-binding domain-containing protein n=1 Tax=Gnomoniopsis smithogilvyi TaxID=1191159 RepID=A0A9W8YMW6_9PEZI|nr:hypothetical protein N0V93_008514 [Gnomoniopsis smithogilvyi]
MAPHALDAEVPLSHEGITATFAPEVAIIGAGLIGLATSVALNRQNPAIKITVYEQKASISELGVGIGVGANAVKAMGLIAPEFREAYDHIVTLNAKDKINTDFDIYCGDGEERGQFIGEKLAREGIPHGGATRTSLIDTLASLMPESIEIVFNKEVKDVEQAPEGGDGRVKVSFTDDTQIVADAVIGCDGIRSFCRRLIVGEDDPSASPRYTGRYCHRGVIPMDQAVKAIGPVAQTRRLILGHDRHILMFPVKFGKGLNVAAFVSTGETSWSKDKWTALATKEDLLTAFKDFDDDSKRLLSLIETLNKWALFEVAEAPTFVHESGQFCILGDAAHASTPHCGAGVGMGLEDAFVLSRLMRPELLKSRTDIKYAFRAYDAVRRPRAQELVRRSRRQGSLFCLQIVGPHEMIEDMDANMAWVWDVDFDSMLSSAKKAFMTFKSQDEGAALLKA